MKNKQTWSLVIKGQDFTAIIRSESHDQEKKTCEISKSLKRTP